MPIKSRTRFVKYLDQGLPRPEAAKLAHVRSRTTAQRWEEEYHLSRAMAKKAAQDAETHRQAALRATVAAAAAASQGHPTCGRGAQANARRPSGGSRQSRCPRGCQSGRRPLREMRLPEWILPAPIPSAT